MSTNLYILIQILICDRGNGAVTNKISRCQCEEITLEGDVTISEELLEKIEQKMHQIVEEDITFRKYSVNTDEAKHLFEYYRMMDKKKLFEYRRVSKANVYDLDGFKDYFYGYMPPSTGMLKYFSLELCEDGFILQLPDRKEPTVVSKWKNQSDVVSDIERVKRLGKNA